MYFRVRSAPGKWACRLRWHKRSKRPPGCTQRAWRAGRTPRRRDRQPCPRRRSGDLAVQSLANLRQLRAQTPLKFIEQFFMQSQFTAPLFLFNGGNTLELRRVKRQAIPGNVLETRRHAEQIFLTLGRAVDAFQHPLEYTHVLAKAGPDELAIVIGLEPVHAENVRQLRTGLLKPAPQIEPMLEVGTHVVTAKRQHGERIATYDALCAGCSGGGF